VQRKLASVFQLDQQLMIWLGHVKAVYLYSVLCSIVLSYSTGNQTTATRDHFCTVIVR